MNPEKQKLDEKENVTLHESSSDAEYYLDALEKTAIEVPQRVLDIFENTRKINEDQNLSFEHWQKLNEEHKKRMQGVSDDDRYYQYEIYRRAGDQLQMYQLGLQLKLCPCGSGKKYKKCHGQ